MLHITQDSLRWLVLCTSIINSEYNCSLLLDFRLIELVDFDSIVVFELSSITIGWRSYHISHNGWIWHLPSSARHALRSGSFQRQHLLLAAWSWSYLATPVYPWVIGVIHSSIARVLPYPSGTPSVTFYSFRLIASWASRIWLWSLAATHAAVRLPQTWR